MLSAPLLLLLLGPPIPAASTSYASEIQAWRKEREAGLEADGGWLTVSGLVLAEGWRQPVRKRGLERDPAPAVGASPRRRHHVPRERGPLPAGGRRSGNDRRRAVTSGALKPDTSGAPDVLSLGRVTLQVIERGGRFGIRVKDLDSERRKAFPGLRWFPVKESYRVVARLVPAPGMVSITNILGQVSEMPRPGHLVFTLNGQELSLDPVLEEPDAKELFIMFRDQTAPKETYGAGRFLYVDLPKDGRVVVDFNKAYSPPCAFTPYATCPLPPKQNRLPVRIEAGELAPEEPSH